MTYIWIINNTDVWKVIRTQEGSKKLWCKTNIYHALLWLWPLRYILNSRSWHILRSSLTVFVSIVEVKFLSKRFVYHASILTSNFEIQVSLVHGHDKSLDLFKNWMLILVLLCENERQRWDASQYIKACSEAQRFYVYRDTSHLWRSFSHNRTKINIQNL